MLKSVANSVRLYGRANGTSGRQIMRVLSCLAVTTGMVEGPSVRLMSKVATFCEVEVRPDVQLARRS